MDLVAREACQNARRLSRICDLLERELGAGHELQEAATAQSVGLSYEELEQYDPSSAYYDPDVGPYYWED